MNGSTRTLNKLISDFPYIMSNQWSDEEYEETVRAYVEMQQKEAAGEKFTKTSYYDALAKRFDRTAKSFEYRMQNISYVYSLLGRNWVTGLKPASHISPSAVGKIERFISVAEKSTSSLQAEFHSTVSELKKKRHGVAPKGKTDPHNSNNTIHSRS